MQELSRLAHSPAAIEKHAEAMHARHVENTAQEAQRGRLRPTSTNISDRKEYNEIQLATAPHHDPGPLAKKRRLDPRSLSRLEALEERLQTRHPTRYDYEGWLSYKNKSIKILQPVYPNSTLVKVSPYDFHNSLFSGSESGL